MDYNDKTYYEILGVDKNASIDSIESARNRLKFENSDYSSSLYGIVDEAYDTLSNPELRKKYDESLKKSKSSKENKEPKLPTNVISNPYARESKEPKLPVNIIPNIYNEEKDNKQQYKILLSNYQKALSKIISINNNNLILEEKDYSEWKPSLQYAYRVYDELVDFCKRNGIDKNFKTVDEILDEQNISKEIHKNEKTEQSDLTKNEKSNSSVIIDPSIYEKTKYVQKNKLDEKYYTTLKKLYESNQKVNRLKFTTIGAGLGFVLLISPIGGFGIVVSTIGAIGIGKLFNSIIKKIQTYNKFTLTKESYVKKITEISTIESQIIHNSNELLKEEIESLASHPNSKFKLELAKLKYLNQVNLLGQIIRVRKNSKSSEGGLTYDSLKLASLNQEYRRAKKDLENINKNIERNKLMDSPYAQNLNLNSIRYKNLTIGNALLKRDIKKNKLKLQKEMFNGFINEEESTKTR